MPGVRARAAPAVEKLRAIRNASPADVHQPRLSQGTPPHGRPLGSRRPFAALTPGPHGWGLTPMLHAWTSGMRVIYHRPRADRASARGRVGALADRPGVLPHPRA